MDSLAFLDQPPTSKFQPIYVVHGEEEFLRRRVVETLRKQVLGDDENASFGCSSYPGEGTEWSIVHAELRTLPFLSPARMVVVDAAEPFIKESRSHLEKYLESPAPSSVLVLNVNSWPATTRLYKLLAGPATIGCKSPIGVALAGWCRKWSSSRYGRKLSVPASQLLVELIGPEMGLLDQELAKLAVYVGEKTTIESDDVDRLVGNSRSENTFDIFRMIGRADATGALTLLDRLMTQGEEPIALLGAFSWQLRKLAQAARLTSRGERLSEAMSRAGVNRPGEAEPLMKHLGMRRLLQLFDRLVELDLDLKGNSALPRQTQLERLVVFLAVPNRKA